MTASTGTGLLRTQREIFCLLVALALHSLLLFWKASSSSLLSGDPIVGVDFVVEEAQPVVTSTEEDKSQLGFMGQLKQALGLGGASDKTVEVSKPESQLAVGEVSQKIQSNTAMRDFEQRPQLVDKSKKINRSFNLDPTASDDPALASVPSSQASIPKGESAGPAKNSAEPLTDRSYPVAKSDLPFQVARAKDGDLLSGQTDADAPRIAVSKKANKGTRRVSTEFTAPVSSESDDRAGGPGLSGTGNFSSSAPPTRSATSSQTGLHGTGPASSNSSGSQGGVGKAYAATRSPSFSGTAYSPGGVSGGSDAGEGTELVQGAGGGKGSKKQGAGNGRFPFELSGPLSARKVLVQALPPYPDWARKEGIIASVSLHFYVLHTGEVKNNIVIHRTSGHPRLDLTAIEALRQWKFEPLPDSSYGKEQWGIITFKFRAR